MTTFTIEKIRNKDLENKYDFIKEGDQLCSKHYPDIVEPDRIQNTGRKKILMNQISKELTIHIVNLHLAN